MCCSIAGAIRIGQWTEMATVESALSAMPFAIFPMMFAVAGTMANRSALSARIDVHRFPIGADIEEVEQDGVSGYDLELDRLYQTGSVFCHDDVHRMPLLHQLAREVNGFMDGNAAGNAEDDGFVFSFIALSSCSDGRSNRNTNVSKTD